MTLPPKNRPVPTGTPLIDEATTARLLGIAAQTLRVRRSEGNPLLSFVRVGRRILYRASAIEQFIDENTVEVGGGAEA
jgi:hypothetical protein